MCSQGCAWCACAGTQCKDDNLLSCSSTQYFGEIPTRLLSSSCRGVVCVARCAVCRQNDTESSQQPPLFCDVRRTEIMVGVSSLACACVLLCVCGGGGGEPWEGCVSVHALHNQISKSPPPGLVTTRNSTHTTQHAQQNVPITLKNCALAHRQARHALWSLYAHRSLSLSQPLLTAPSLYVHLTATSTATCSPRSSPALPHSPA